jgi:hypothetical protein
MVVEFEGEKLPPSVKTARFRTKKRDRSLLEVCIRKLCRNHLKSEFVCTKTAMLNMLAAEDVS